MTKRIYVHTIRQTRTHSTLGQQAIFNPSRCVGQTRSNIYKSASKREITKLY